MFKLGRLDFYEPDYDTFEGLKLAYRAAETGGSMPTVYNAANEFAVAKFLNREIEYMDITDFIREAMEAHQYRENPNVNEILSTEAETYEFLKHRLHK